MRSLLLLLLIISFCACKSKSAITPPNAVPQALQETEDRSLLSSKDYSKGRNGNLVEELYEELLEQNAALKSFEKELSALRLSIPDTIALFGKYNSKSESYYNAAQTSLLAIQDSVFRKQIESIVTNSNNNYKTLIARDTQLLAQIEKASARLSDLQYALKVAYTIPMIEKYQRENLPPVQSFEDLLQRQNKAVKEAEALLNK